MRKKILLFFMFVSILFTCDKVNALASLSCDSSAYVGENVVCEVKTDEEVSVTSALKISSVSGEKNSYSGNVATLNSNGTVVFKADVKGKFEVTIENKNEDAKFTDTSVVTVMTKTTATTTTTTKEKSSNNYLSMIKFNGEELEDFSKTKTKYYVDVDFDVEKISLEAKAEDDKSVIEIDGPKTLEVGENEYTIGVTSEDNTTKFYKVIVTRKEEGKSSDTSLSNISIKGYDLQFDKDSKTFHLKVKSEVSKLNITVKTSDKNATYEITNNENLKDGSIIKIKVTAENGDEDEYRIIIEKEQEKKSNAIIFVIVFLIIIALLVTFIVIKNKKSKDSGKVNKNKKDDEKQNKEENDEELEKTKTIDVISDEATKEIDNDEEEKTRFLSYEEAEELEKTKILDLNNNVEDNEEDLDKKIDDELEKTFSFNDF